MKSSSASEYKPGDKILTRAGFVGIVNHVSGGRYVIVDFPKELGIDKKVYIPGHAEIELYRPYYLGSKLTV